MSTGLRTTGVPVRSHILKVSPELRDTCGARIVEGTLELPCVATGQHRCLRRRPLPSSLSQAVLRACPATVVQVGAALHRAKLKFLPSEVAYSLVAQHLCPDCC